MAILKRNQHGNYDLLASDSLFDRNIKNNNEATGSDADSGFPIKIVMIYGKFFKKNSDEFQSMYQDTLQERQRVKKEQPKKIVHISERSKVSEAPDLKTLVGDVRIKRKALQAISLKVEKTIINLYNRPEEWIVSDCPPKEKTIVKSIFRHLRFNINECYISHYALKAVISADGTLYNMQKDGQSGKIAMLSRNQFLRIRNHNLVKSLKLGGFPLNLAASNK